MRIGQICVLPLTSPSEHPYGASVYGSRYQGQRGPDAVAVLPQLQPHAPVVAGHAVHLVLAPEDVAEQPEDAVARP
jgi:hypothetical protein